jgi:uncharacterized membrane protein YkgB
MSKRILAAGIDLFIISFFVDTPMILLGYDFIHKYGYYFYLLGIVLFVLKDVSARSIGKVIFKLNIYNDTDFKKVPT